MTSRIALIAGTVALLAAAPAGAKEIGSVSLCGAGGCTDVTKGATHAILEGGPPVEAPTRSVPYFVMRVGIAEKKGGKVVHRFRTRWYPKLKMLRAEEGVWMDAPQTTQAALVRLSKGLKPSPAEKWPPASKPPAVPEPTPAAPAAAPTRPVSRTTEEDGGGGPGTALAIGAPALAALAIGGVLARRRRPRRR